MASISTLSPQDALDSQYLSTSISHLSRAKTSNSLIVRTYKQATQLYLTKRFKESLDVLEPIITPIYQQVDAFNGGQIGDSDPDRSQAALIAQSSRGTRTKVWVFYLSLIHAIIELGPEEGKLFFGSSSWRQIVAKAREGTAWEEIVQRGYGGNEGEVDAEVVQNLSTLLLGHMQDQKFNQLRLESWLSQSGDGGPNLMFEGIGSPLPSGASTPKVLNTRLKVLELYALHVLPANDEWDYAREFIEMNGTLDEERKEMFLYALENLKDEKDGAALREAALKEQREREMEAQRLQEETRRAEQARKEEERRQAAEAERIRVSHLVTNHPNTPTGNSSSGGGGGGGGGGPGTTGERPPTRPPSAKPVKKPRSLPPPPRTLYNRASIVIHNLQTLVLQAGRNVAGNNMALLRAFMVFVAFLLILARRDLRFKIRRALAESWAKVQETVGMGVKVSYL